MWNPIKCLRWIWCETQNKMSLENFNLERISTLKKGEKVGAKKNSQVKASHLPYLHSLTIPIVLQILGK